MKKIWITKNGDEIEYAKLSDSHLLNVIKFVERRAEELDGEVIDGGGFDSDDMWYEIGEYKDWLRKFDHKGLVKELKKRMKNHD